jgi:DNA-binding beta-propeller fold protein YncE
MDYIAYDRAHHQVWVPAGNTGSVDVVDTRSEKITQLDGFPTAEVERGGTKRTVGPSSAAVGNGVVYVGNRADSAVCVIDASALVKGACLKLESSPDGLAYVAATKELWVTTPRDKSITILDTAAASLAAKAKIALEGLPEGFAVDDERGVFYTNLEDKNRTLGIDVKSRAVVKTWVPKCSDDGPRGLAIDTRLNFLFVACTDQVVVLDAGHDGKLLSSIETGAGIDNIDYVPSRRELYAAAARAARLSVAHLDARGKLAPVASVATATGARNAVATEEGVAYLTDSAGGKLLVVAPAR